MLNTQNTPITSAHFLVNNLQIVLDVFFPDQQQVRRVETLFFLIAVFS